MPTDVPPSPPGDGAAAQAILRELEGSGHDGGPLKAPPNVSTPDAAAGEAARVTAEPIKSAKRALERARGARAAGDEAHARMLDGLALEWAETARDLERAAAAEAVATAIAQKLAEEQTQAERARALLEETQARRGRAAAELARVEAEAKEAARGAADAEAHRLGVAKKKDGKAAPAAPKEKAASPPKKVAP
jgi:hypothetical protein